MVRSEAVIDPVGIFRTLSGGETARENRPMTGGAARATQRRTLVPSATRRRRFGGGAE